MRKQYFLLLIFAFLAMGKAPVFADTIGFVDTERLFKDSKKVQVEVQNVQKKREEYQKIVDEKEKKVSKLKEDKVSEDILKKEIAEAEKELLPKKTELEQLVGELQKSFLSKVSEFVKQVSKKYNVDVVLDKRAVLQGGFDLTDFVLEKLNK